MVVAPRAFHHMTASYAASGPISFSYLYADTYRHTYTIGPFTSRARADSAWRASSKARVGHDDASLSQADIDRALGITRRRAAAARLGSIL